MGGASYSKCLRPPIGERASLAASEEFMAQRERKREIVAQSVSGYHLEITQVEQDMWESIGSLRVHEVAHV